MYLLKYSKFHLKPFCCHGDECKQTYTHTHSQTYAIIILNIIIFEGFTEITKKLNAGGIIAKHGYNVSRHKLKIRVSNITLSIQWGLEK